VSVTPRLRVIAERDRRGAGPLAAGCAALLDGRPEEVSDALILTLGGESAVYILDGGAGGRNGYWPRVWAARGLLHAWDPAATAALRADPVERVRAAARAVTVLTAAGA
jgi:hypothetical protein